MLLRRMHVHARESISYIQLYAKCRIWSPQLERKNGLFIRNLFLCGGGGVRTEQEYTASPMSGVERVTTNHSTYQSHPTPTTVYSSVVPRRGWCFALERGLAANEIVTSFKFWK